MDIQIDSSGELVFDGGDLVLLDGVDAIAQHVRIALRLFKGECAFAPDEGVPWIQSLFTKPTRIQLVTAVLRRAILAVPGVTEINKFDLSFEPVGRRLSLSFAATTTSGAVIEFSEYIV